MGEELGGERGPASRTGASPGAGLWLVQPLSLAPPPSWESPSSVPSSSSPDRRLQAVCTELHKRDPAICRVSRVRKSPVVSPVMGQILGLGTELLSHSQSEMNQWKTRAPCDFTVLLVACPSSVLPVTTTQTPATVSKYLMV